MLPTRLPDEEPAPCQGQTPARVLIDRVVPYPIDGQSVSVTLRNVGGQNANLTGWRLTDSDTRNVEAAQVCASASTLTLRLLFALSVLINSNTIPANMPHHTHTHNAAQNFVFGTKPCDTADNTTIAPGGTLELTPKSDTNPCGFPFGVSFRDEINLFDGAGTLVASAKWGSATQGAAQRLLPVVSTATANGAEAYGEPLPGFREVPEDKSVLDTLSAQGGYTMFLEALQVCVCVCVLRTFN
jgi:hypothetical protein